jgi:hypothetical protein
MAAQAFDEQYANFTLVARKGKAAGKGKLMDESTMAALCNTDPEAQQGAFESVLQGLAREIPGLEQDHVARLRSAYSNAAALASKAILGKIRANPYSG